MRLVTPRDSCHTVYMYGGRLCVECKVCRHRVALMRQKQRDVLALALLANQIERLKFLHIAFVEQRARVKEAEDWERGIEPIEED